MTRTLVSITSTTIVSIPGEGDDAIEQAYVFMQRYRPAAEVLKVELAPQAKDGEV